MYCLNQNSQAVKKECGPKKARVKKDGKSKVSLGGGYTNSAELSLLKFLPLTYHHSHFLAATLDFTSFFTLAFFGAAFFFTDWLFWFRYHFFLYSKPQSRLSTGFGTYSYCPSNLK